MLARRPTSRIRPFFAPLLRSGTPAVVCVAAALYACGGSDPDAATVDERLSGGATTVFDDTSGSYKRPAANLDDEALRAFSLGDHLFNRGWVTAPASIPGGDGLGPTFNANNCSSCHAKSGNGGPPEAEGEAFLSLLLRLSIPGTGPHGAPNPEPSYGDQFNSHGISGVPGEGRERVRYVDVPGTYGDGTPYTLRKPVYSFEDLAFGPMDPATMVSPRLARPVFGLGLLETIPEEAILAKADPNDADGNGISGRPNRVWSVRKQALVLGRVGWKANQPNVEQQTAGAFLGDMGITSSLFPEENCPSVQTACRAAPTGVTPGSPAGTGELSDADLDALNRWGKTLAVPARRDVDDPQVRAGQALFKSAGCVQCHADEARTGNDPEFPALSNQVIHPYSDLLLHDMGEGLADGRPDFEATGSEWRTPPLWGIGLLNTVNKHNFLLHDGRARGFAEAILWHDGEAAGPRETFRAMTSKERDALVRFLQSL